MRPLKLLVLSGLYQAAIVVRNLSDQVGTLLLTRFMIESAKYQNVVAAEYPSTVKAVVDIPLPTAASKKESN